jgi:cobalt transporter subunit CbtA
MAVLRRLVFAALCAGLLSGVFATVAHQIVTVPLILQAETYERPSERAMAAAHEHNSSAWEPENGAERTAYTLLADILTGVGFALLVGAGLTLRGGEVGWRQGLLWGLAGFATFVIAPSLGLPPQLPGTEAAPLFDRQLWWLGTAVATSCALALIAFATRARWTILAALLVVLPHLYGAPEPPEDIAAAPAALSHHFIVAATMVNFLFWLILGASTGYFHERLQLQIARPGHAAA